MKTLGKHVLFVSKKLKALSFTLLSIKVSQWFHLQINITLMTLVSCLWTIKSRFKNNVVQEAWGFIRIIWMCPRWCSKLWFNAKFFLMRECAEPRDWPVETGLSQVCQLSWPSVTSFSHLSLKCPVHCLTSCGTSWVRIFQEWNYFLSYHYAADHFESSFGVCWCNFLVMATLGIFPDHAQGRLPYNALPSIPSPTLFLPTTPVPLGHSSITAHRMASFL